MDEEQITISEAAGRLGLTAHTLRYYERAGLVEPVGRDAAGRRRYRPSDLDWFAFLIRLRQTGMPISEMRAYAALRAHGDGTLCQRRDLLREHRGHVAEHLARLTSDLAALDAKILHYDHLIEKESDQ